MTSSFSKKVLIEQDELNRRKLRQLREHSPELLAMVRFLNNIRDIKSNKNLTAEKRLHLIFSLQIQITKLKKEMGLLNGAMQFEVSLSRHHWRLGLCRLRS